MDARIQSASQAPGRGVLRRMAGLTVALALAGAAATVVQAQPTMHHVGPGMAGGPMLYDRMLDAVGASADQKARVHEILGRSHDEARAQHDSARALRQQMMALLAAPQVDAAAAENLRQQLLARHDAASRRHLQAMLDVSAVLTPEQRQKLAERAQTRREMMERHQRERQSVMPRG